MQEPALILDGPHDNSGNEYFFIWAHLKRQEDFGCLAKWQHAFYHLILSLICQWTRNSIFKVVTDTAWRQKMVVCMNRTVVTLETNDCGQVNVGTKNKIAIYN